MPQIGTPPRCAVEHKISTTWRPASERRGNGSQTAPTPPPKKKRQQRIQNPGLYCIDAPNFRPSTGPRYLEQNGHVRQRRRTPGTLTLETPTPSPSPSPPTWSESISIPVRVSSTAAAAASSAARSSRSPSPPRPPPPPPPPLAALPHGLLRGCRAAGAAAASPTPEVEEDAALPRLPLPSPSPSPSPPLEGSTSSDRGMGSAQFARPLRQEKKKHQAKKTNN